MRRTCIISVLITILGAALICGALYALFWLGNATIRWIDEQDWSTGFGSYYDGSTGQYERGKTLWDWLDLIIVPAVLATSALWFNRQISKRDEERKEDRSQEDTLIAYIDAMADLLLKRELRSKLEGRVSDDEREPPVIDVARVRTVTALRKADRERRNEVLNFLRDANLLTGERTVLQTANMRNIDLSGANLSGANLSGANLQGAKLWSADLSEADLRGADLQRAKLWTRREFYNQASLSGADLREAKLSYTDLRKTPLSGADLRGANLSYADLQNTPLSGADLRGANLSGVFLNLADLRGANLSGVDLSGVSLQGANLNLADLRGANLSGANLNDADLQGAHLFVTHSQGTRIETRFSETTTLPDSTNWTPDTDMVRFTDADHPDFWRSDFPYSRVYRGKTRGANPSTMGDND